MTDNRRLVAVVKIPENRVDRVVPGQSAEVRVDAFPGEVLTGKVRDVAPLPDPGAFLENVRKVYTTRLLIERAPEGLRPGMTAQANDCVVQLDDVLCVPVPAVARFDGKDHVAVVKPGGEVDWREVLLVETDGREVEVKWGLRAGDRVAVSPIALMTEDEKRQRFGGSAATASPPKPDR